MVYATQKRSSLCIKRHKVSVCMSVTLGVASSVANDVIMRMGVASAIGARRHNDNSWLMEIW